MSVPPVPAPVPVPARIRLRLRRAALTLAGAGLAVVAIPTAAQAHVEIEPGSVAGGDFSVVALRVPNERDDASTVQLRLLLPADQPLGSVSTAAIPGWRVSTRTRQLAKPLDMEGGQVDSVVSEVTWRSTTGGVRPGQYQDFPLDLGQLPETGRLVFTAVQTYSTGERVVWNEVAASGAEEPEHPAPVLEVTAPTEEGSATHGHSSDADPSTKAATTTDAVARSTSATSGDRSVAGTTTIILSAAALLLAAAAAALSGLSWRRTRR